MRRNRRKIDSAKEKDEEEDDHENDENDDEKFTAPLAHNSNLEKYTLTKQDSRETSRLNPAFNISTHTAKI